MKQIEPKKKLNKVQEEDLEERAQSIKWALESRIKQYTPNYETACLCVIYMAIKTCGLYDNSLELDYFEIANRLEDAEITRYILNIINDDIWNATKEICYGTSKDILERIPFLTDTYSGKSGELSTPKSICNLAKEVLKISKNETIADICCGKGNFLINTYLDSPDNKFYGIDNNTDCVYVTKMRFDLLSNGEEKNIEIIQDSIFNINYNETKFDKIFSHYPFGMRAKYNHEMFDYLRQFNDFGFTDGTSSEWIFNSIIQRKLTEKGKAVVIMPNSPLFRLGNDEKIREQFINNGYIEAIIALPKNMFDYTAIPTSMVILGRNNKNSIRMVDAASCFEVARRINVLSDKNIDTIIKSLSVDSDISREVDVQELKDNDYNLLPQRYLNNTIDFKNGVEFGSIIKSITRGAGISASELDKISSTEKTDYQYIMLANIKGGIIDSNLPYITEIPKKYDRYCVNNNNLLLSKNGAPYKVAVATVNKNSKVLANGNLFVIEVDEEMADPHYLKAFFNSQEGNKVLSSLSSNGSIPSISVNDLKKVKIPLPSLKIQNDISKDFLILEDEIKVLEKKISKCREKLVGIFNEKEVN